MWLPDRIRVRYWGVGLVQSALNWTGLGVFVGIKTGGLFQKNTEMRPNIPEKKGHSAVSFARSYKQDTEYDHMK